MPLVELVPAPWTAPEVVTRTRKLMKDIGQTPITLKKEVTGFIQPRIQFALVQECLKLVIVSNCGQTYIVIASPVKVYFSSFFLLNKFHWI